MVQINRQLADAVFKHQLFDVVRLLEEGADPDCSFVRGQGILFEATLIGDLNIVVALLAYHADPNRVSSQGSRPDQVAHVPELKNVLLVFRGDVTIERKGLRAVFDALSDDGRHVILAGPRGAKNEAVSDAITRLRVAPASRNALDDRLCNAVICAETDECLAL